MVPTTTPNTTRIKYDVDCIELGCGTLSGGLDCTLSYHRVLTYPQAHLHPVVEPSPYPVKPARLDGRTVLTDLGAWLRIRLSPLRLLTVLSSFP